MKNCVRNRLSSGPEGIELMAPNISPLSAPPRMMRTCGPPMPGLSGFLPKLKLQLRRELRSHCPALRALLRPTPTGRSLTDRSLLSSKPVVTLYGRPEFALKIELRLRDFVSLKFVRMLKRWRVSCIDGPRSPRRSKLSVGRLNAPSVSSVVFDKT